MEETTNSNQTKRTSTSTSTVVEPVNEYRNSNENSQDKSQEASKTSTTLSNPLEVTSDEINFLVYRYLIESGFVHTAFTFAYESCLGDRVFRNIEVPPGALISFLQKGLQYIGIEESLTEDGADKKKRKRESDEENQDEVLSLLSPKTCKALSKKDPTILLNVPPASATAALKAKLDSASKSDLEVQIAAAQQQQQAKHQALNLLQQVQLRQHLNLPSENMAVVAAMSQLQRQVVPAALTQQPLLRVEDKRTLAQEKQNGQKEKNPPTIVTSNSETDDVNDSLTLVDSSEVLELSKHIAEVFMCCWNPCYTTLLATGSGDASARIWNMSGLKAKSGYNSCKLLQHGSAGDKNKDVTTLVWSPDGENLATGSYDGIARVWRRSGTILMTLRGHQGPIFSLKWNKRGTFLLSGSYDQSTIVWDVTEIGYVKQQFCLHSAPTLDVDWKDDYTFASCSTDKTVLICRVGQQKPIKTYTGHTDEVNAVKWNPSGTLLATCSDDNTAKVWDINSPSQEPKWDFKAHQQEIYTVKWSPTGLGSKNPGKVSMLATASFDGSVGLWNAQTGTCIRVLSRHKESVYAVAFSPKGDYLASGSLAGQLYIWKISEGKQVLSYKGEGDIFEVAWNVEGTRVASCSSSNVVSLIDFNSNT